MVHFQALAARHLGFKRVEAKHVQDGGVDVCHVMDALLSWFIPITEV